MNILMISHSYAVALNRRLCRELARTGNGHISVSVAAPAFYWGDLRPITLEQLEGEPYVLEAIPVRFSRTPHVFLYGRKLKTLLGGTWDVVHAWEEPYIVAGWQIARAAPPQATLIYSTFQNQHKRYPPPFCWIERYCLARATGWTAFGQTIADNLKNRPGYRDRPAQTIPLGVDLDVFCPNPSARRQVLAELGWSENGPPIVGYLGRFVPEKGLELLTKTLDRLPPSSWRALLVGGGRLEGQLCAWAERHGGRARVIGGVFHDRVPAYLNAMDLLAAPSQTTPRWKEQFGRMLLEGMACGLPVVASDSGEIPHVLADAGRILPEADASAWVEGVGALLENSALRSELRKRALARVTEVYAWPRVSQQFLSFFQELR